MSVIQCNQCRTWYLPEYIREKGICKFCRNQALIIWYQLEGYNEDHKKSKIQQMEYKRNDRPTV